MNAFANHPSEIQRQKLLARTLIGDCTFALERPKIRQCLFLQRNIWQSLEYHEERLKGDPTSTTLRPPATAYPHIADHISKGSASGATGSKRMVAPALTNGVNTPIQAHSAAGQALSTNFDTATVPQATQRKSQQRGRITRRSDRFKQIVDRIYDQGDSELILDLSNIRKKLNFKSNSLGDGERPAKRQKRNTVKCFCHMTIWDNRDASASIPLTTKSSYCYVTGVDNGAHGSFVDLELDNPFVIKAAEIRVPVTMKKITGLELIDKYFLEFKIIPCRVDSRWPPMPVLGKSDGDHFGHDIKKGGSEELQGAIVARYTHLPTAPDTNLPLGVYFLHEGRTFRTKYGLQVISHWQKAGAGYIKQESKGLDLESFLRDRPNGASEPGKTVSPSSKPLIASAARKSPKPPPHQPEICYSFSGKMADRSDVAQEFRNATAKGYYCPLCDVTSFHKLQYLQFHLTTTHTKYSFSVQKPRRHPNTNELSQVTIKVDQPNQLMIKKEEEERQNLSWIAPAASFDLGAFVSGNHSWTNETVASSTKPPRLIMPTSSGRPTTGYPQARNVPDFRKADRKRWKAITLETKRAHDEPESVYTSISHRPISPSEDPRSETDDEIDNEWQIATHLERLDLVAAEENWSPYKRELTKRWDRHRMEEQLEHSKYLSNSLIRFARKQKEWLRSSEDDELLQCFFDFLMRLEDRRVIDDNVIADVNELVFVDGPAPASPQKRPEQTRTERQEPQTEETQSHVPSPRACPLCSDPLMLHHKTTTFCQDPACAIPSQKYHKRCALESSASRKGKEKAGVAVQDEAMRLKSWCCKDCIGRQRDWRDAKEEELEEKKRREREIVEEGAKAVLGSMS